MAFRRSRDGQCNGAVAALLAEECAATDAEIRTRFLQGVDMGRPSLLQTLCGSARQGRVRARRRSMCSGHGGVLTLREQPGDYFVEAGAMNRTLLTLCAGATVQGRRGAATRGFDTAGRRCWCTQARNETTAPASRAFAEALPFATAYRLHARPPTARTYAGPRTAVTICRSDGDARIVDGLSMARGLGLAMGYEGGTAPQSPKLQDCLDVRAGGAQGQQRALLRDQFFGEALLRAARSSHATTSTGSTRHGRSGCATPMDQV